MMVSVDIQIKSPKADVWRAITDIQNAGRMISSIMKITILDRPEESLVGLKWQETRRMFGKEAMETMWITDAVLFESYSTRAESHGSVYITRLSLVETAEGTQLTMSFTATAQSLGVRLVSFLMGPLIRGSLKKALKADLQDIKTYMEKTRP